MREGDTVCRVVCVCVGGGGGGGTDKDKTKSQEEKRRGFFHVVYPCTVPKSTLLSR